MPAERLQKILAQAGFGSRRSNEELITAGRVRVNGEVAQLGSKADPAVDKISVDGRPIPPVEVSTYIAVYKPRGVITAVEPGDDRPTVREIVPVKGHLYPVGRLDFDSEGLTLLTNDGELANRLTHPRYGHEKEYRVLVGTRPDARQLDTWRRGVVLEDGTRTLPAQVEVESETGKGAWLRVILKEGKKRQIRETGERIGLPVIRIVRVRLGTLRLGSLKPREWRFLSSDEIAELKSAAGLGGKGRFSIPTPGKTAKPRPFSGRGKPGTRKPGKKLTR